MGRTASELAFHDLHPLRSDRQPDGALEGPLMRLIEDLELILNPKMNGHKPVETQSEGLKVCSQRTAAEQAIMLGMAGRAVKRCL